MKTVLKITLGVLLASVVLIAGCVALIGGAANEVSETLTTEQNADAISLEEYRAVEIGSTRSEVEAELGEPGDKQEFESEGFLDDEPQSSSCIYYNRRGGEIGDAFQLCFDGDRLTSKNAF